MTLPTLHVLGLAHPNLTDDYAWCAYTGKVRRFAPMMTAQGYDVVIYHSGDGETNPRWAKATEYVQILGEEDRLTRFPHREGGDNTPPWKPQSYKAWNRLAIVELKKRVKPGDILCFSAAGHLQQPIAAAFPDNISCEFGVGYEGTFTPYRCFETYAWMHTVYGYQQGAMKSHGNNYDVVIPNYFDVEQFPERAPMRDEAPYLLFLARLEVRKGIHEAIEVANHAGLDLICAGYGQLPVNEDLRRVSHVGFVRPLERARLLQHATALIQPTLYVEPFGGCAAEALLSGVPVITTDWGGFTDYVGPGDGYRCRTLMEYVEAVVNLEGDTIGAAKMRRDRAIARFSMEACGPQYDEWFWRLTTLREDGWYTGYVPGKAPADTPQI